jgi:hypothetical protein
VGVRIELGSLVLPEAASATTPKPKLLSATQQPTSNIKPNIAHTFVSGRGGGPRAQVGGSAAVARVQQVLVLTCLACRARRPTPPPQRPPAKRAPAVVSLAFTGLSVVPLLALLAYLAALGVNVKVRLNMLATWQLRGAVSARHLVPPPSAHMAAHSPHARPHAHARTHPHPHTTRQGLPYGASTLWVLLFHGGIAALLGLFLLFWARLNLAQTLTPAALLGLFTAGEAWAPGT